MDYGPYKKHQSDHGKFWTVSDHGIIYDKKKGGMDESQEHMCSFTHNKTKGVVFN